jgi:hypothetical protein
MNPPIIDLIGFLGEISLEILNNIDTSIDKRLLNKANKIADVIRNIPDLDGFQDYRITGKYKR